MFKKRNGGLRMRRGRQQEYKRIIQKRLKDNKNSKFQRLHLLKENQNIEFAPIKSTGRKYKNL